MCGGRADRQILWSKEGNGLGAPDIWKLQDFNLNKTKTRVAKMQNITFSMWERQLPGL